MKYVKLVVFYLYMNTFVVCFGKYCKLCSNHTLCKYTKSGPGTLCYHYDYKSPLTESEVDDILNAINEIRSFVAMGRSKHLPPAANMRKVVWSAELATFAQRWVDQCSPSIQPDEQDECRDLVDAKVGQNIATVTGATAGISVKSFVEMWHMQLRYFSRNVSYYKTAVESKAQYFTQLIWADTYLVGCGKARFYVKHKNVSFERLVCNFAPKGNIEGKSVYATADAGTQCPNNTVRDPKWKGICSPQNEFNGTAISSKSKQDLLRSTNLSNNSLKQEIDPVDNGLIQSKTSDKKNKKHRNNKIRHIFYNDTYDDPNNSRGRHFTSDSRKRLGIHKLHHYHKNKSNSGLYQNNKESKNSENYYKEDLSHNIEMATLTNTLRTFFSTADRSCNSNFRLCTRKIETSSTKCRLSKILSGQCTRKTNPSTKLTFANNKMHNSYVYNTPKTWQTLALNEVSKCTCDTNCRCLSGKCSTTLCPHEHVSVTLLTTKQLEDPRYYNLLPNVVVRREDVTNTPMALNGPSIRQQNVWPIKTYTPITENESQMNNDRKSYDNSENEYSYDDFRFNMHKRNAEGETFKPFWQVDDYQLNKDVQTKSLKYTTLPNKRSKKVKQITSLKITYTTEPITIKNSSNIARIQPITEKYLSFEELMHIKRFNGDLDLRRTPVESTDESTETPPKDYTTNTVFVRKKHCTRKRTCTWTEPTASDGKVIAGNRGQKTPPGYVDGCTRTSTCTRDFMERNKFQDQTSSSLESTPENESEDEDYCEKRSLERSRKVKPKEIQKKHINIHTLTDNWISKYHITNSFSNPVTEYKLEEKDTETLISNNEKVTTAIEICDCDRNVRKKRNQNANTSMQNINIAEKKSKQSLSYKDIYKIVLGKSAISYRDGIKTSCIRKHCTCNADSVKKNCYILLFFIFVILISLF